MNSALDRRSFLLAGIASLGFGSWRRRQHDSERKLVILQLSGGNDGLSTVVPYADDAYQKARRTLRFEERECLRLDDYRGFHPALERLHACFQEGNLALVEGVGYPRPNRSHFKSLEIWHTADPRGRSAGDGWVGRLCASAFGADARPNRVVHVGPDPSYAVHSSAHPAAVFSVPEIYRWVKNEGELERMEQDGESGSGEQALSFLRRRMREARDSSAAVRSAVARYATTVDYPGGSFGHSLRIAAALLDADIGTRVVSLELGGFDTHNDQRDRLGKLLRTLDQGLGAFLADLQRTESGRDTLVLVFSEFGRRVAENGSRGTDHGCAGPVFLAGEGVKGGLYGRHPSLVELDEGDLIHTTDFRSVYATAIEHVFGLDPATVLGGDHPRLECLRRSRS